MVRTTIDKRGDRWVLTISRHHCSSAVPTDSYTQRPITTDPQLIMPGTVYWGYETLKVGCAQDIYVHYDVVNAPCLVTLVTRSHFNLRTSISQKYLVKAGYLVRYFSYLVIVVDIWGQPWKSVQVKVGSTKDKQSNKYFVLFIICKFLWYIAFLKLQSTTLSQLSSTWIGLMHLVSPLIYPWATDNLRCKTTWHLPNCAREPYWIANRLLYSIHP